MKDISKIVDQEIRLLESSLDIRHRHVMKTETIRQRVLQYFDSAEAIINAQLESEGLTQVIQRRLHANGYRSVRKGYFVNLERCFDIPYLNALQQNADITAAERELAAERIRKIREERLDGQLYFDKNMDIYVPMNESEFMVRLERDAV